MNQDTILRIVKDVLLSFGSILAARGVITEDQWTLIVGALIGIATVLWQVYVKWDTVSVPSSVVDETRRMGGRHIPTVSPITGQISA